MSEGIKLRGAKQRVIALILGIAIFAYAVYHIVSLFGEDIETITTGMSTQTKVIDSKGYVFRDETPLYSSNTGVADYLKGDGEKVSVGEELARVYSDGGDASKKMIRYYDQKIAILEQSTESGATLAALPEVNTNISDAYYEIAKMIASGSTGDMFEQTDKLLTNMNTHSLLIDENSPVENTLDSMIEKRAALLAAGGRSTLEVAEEGGYFYSYVDGFEGAFTAQAAQNLTASTFYELTGSAKVADRNITDKAYGKMSDSSRWYFAVRLAQVQSEYFELGKEYVLRFTENGNTPVPMTLNSEVEDTEFGGKILVFYCNRLPEGFVFDRCQSVSVEVSSVTGIYVPKSALHRMGGQRCVYVLSGSVVTLRRIDVIFETADYCLCAPYVESDGSAEFLDTNELLIIKGSNLFNGRILD